MGLFDRWRRKRRSRGYGDALVGHQVMTGPYATNDMATGIIVGSALGDDNHRHLDEHNRNEQPADSGPRSEYSEYSEYSETQTSDGTDNDGSYSDSGPDSGTSYDGGAGY